MSKSFIVLTTFKAVATSTNARNLGWLGVTISKQGCEGGTPRILLHFNFLCWTPFLSNAFKYFLCFIPVYDLPHFILSCRQISLTPQILSIVRTLIMSTFPDMYTYVHLYMDISINTRAGWLFQLGCPDSTCLTLNFSSLTPACCFLAFLAITSSITSQPPIPQILQSHPELCLHLLTPGNHEWISTSIAT